MRKGLAVWVVLILVSSGVAFAQSTSVIATITQEVTSGMFTLTAAGTTTANVNVLNLGGLTFPTAATCAATVSLWSSTGSQIGTSKTITVASGVAGSVSFTESSGIYRVVISYPLTPAAAPTTGGGTVIPVRASCSLVPTLELQNGAGSTVVYITQFYGVPQISPLSPLLSRP